MKIERGILYLTKSEIEALDVVAKHSAIDQSYEGGGSFNKGDNENTYDYKEGNKAILGRKVIEFIIHFTK